MIFQMSKEIFLIVCNLLCIYYLKHRECQDGYFDIIVYICSKARYSQLKQACVCAADVRTENTTSNE